MGKPLGLQIGYLRRETILEVKKTSMNNKPYSNCFINDGNENSKEKNLATQIRSLRGEAREGNICLNAYSERIYVSKSNESNLY
jgi:hypothetical protein